MVCRAQVLPRGWSAAAWAYAQGSWAMWHTAALAWWGSGGGQEPSPQPAGVRLYNILGEAAALSTPFDLAYLDAVPTLPFLRDQRPVFGWSHGDGVVPRQSARAALYPAAQHHAVMHTSHAGLLRNAHALGLITEHSGVACEWEGLWLLPTPGRGTGHAVRLWRSGRKLYGRVDTGGVLLGHTQAGILEGHLHTLHGAAPMQGGLHSATLTFSVLPRPAPAHRAPMHRAFAWALLCVLADPPFNSTNHSHALSSTPCDEPRWQHRHKGPRGHCHLRIARASPSLTSAVCRGARHHSLQCCLLGTC